MRTQIENCPQKKLIFFNKELCRKDGETEGYAGKEILSMKRSGRRYGCCLNSNYKTKLLKKYESLLNFGINFGINIILVLMPSVFPVSVREVCMTVHKGRGRKKEPHILLCLSPSIPLRHSLSLSLHCARLEHQQWYHQSSCLYSSQRSRKMPGLLPWCAASILLFVCLFYSFSITTTVLPLNLKELYAVC